MGYWDQGRGNETFGLNRFSVNALHPQEWVMREPLKQTRFLKKPQGFADWWNPDGHVVLVGLGPKTADQYGLRGSEWEARKLAQIRAALPGRKVIFRPKPGSPFTGLDVEADQSSPIERVLDGAYLAVCRHSNVAIDAMRCGIPAAVEDGAAAAVCGPGFVDRKPVSEAVRAEFFRNLSWFQWSIQECWKGDCWPFLLKLIEQASHSRT
jgi:hypothetical protein